MRSIAETRGPDLSPPADLRHGLRSQRAQRSSYHRDDFELGVAVLRLAPRALDCNDHLLGPIAENELAKDASRGEVPLLTPPGKGGTARQ